MSPVERKRGHKQVMGSTPRVLALLRLPGRAAAAASRRVGALTLSRPWLLRSFRFARRECMDGPCRASV